MDWTAASNCACFFCQEGKVHPERHNQWQAVSGRLKVAESLDPVDRVLRRSCTTCGHIQENT